MEENKTPAAGILRIPCRGCSLPYDGAIDWVGYFLHVPRKCHIRYRAANIAQSLFVITHPVPCRQYHTVAIRYHTSGTVPSISHSRYSLSHIRHRAAITATYQK